MKFYWNWILLLILAQSGCAGTPSMQTNRTLSLGRPSAKQTVTSVPSAAATRYHLDGMNRSPFLAKDRSVVVSNRPVVVSDRPFVSEPAKSVADQVIAKTVLLESNRASEQRFRSKVKPVSFAESLEFQDDEKPNAVNQESGLKESGTDEVEKKEADEQEPEPIEVAPPRPPLESIEAPAATSGYTLPDLEQIAIANNPTLAAAQVAICKAAGLKHQVGILPNPTAGYFGQQLADQGTAQNALFIEREFVRGDKLRLNREVLSHTTCAQQREFETQQYRVLTDVRIRFYEAIAAQLQLKAAKSLQATARRGVEIAGDRLEAEEGSRIEVLQSETLLSEITLSVERTEIAYLAAWKDLAAVAGLPDTAPANLVGQLVNSKNLPDWQAVYHQIVLQSPELSVARALIGEKAALLRRQQVQAVPNITGQLAAGYDNGTNSGMINVQVSAPIPASNKNRGNISAANADYMQAVENVRRLEQFLKSRMARVAQDFESALAAVNKYEDEIIPQSAKGLELSEKAYQAGELDFLQVLILRRSYFESMIRSIEAKSQLAQAAAKIDGLLLTGGLDAPQDHTAGDGLRGDSFGGQ